MNAVTLFDYCVYAQRLGASRELAWKTRGKGGDETRRADFDRAWKAARAAEELRAAMPGLARSGQSILRQTREALQ